MMRTLLISLVAVAAVVVAWWAWVDDRKPDDPTHHDDIVVEPQMSPDRSAPIAIGAAVEDNDPEEETVDSVPKAERVIRREPLKRGGDARVAVGYRPLLWPSGTTHPDPSNRASSPLGGPSPSFLRSVPPELPSP